MLALPLKFPVAPRAHDHVERFRQPLLRIVPVVAENRVLLRMHAASRAEIHPPAGELVYHGKFFGDAQWIVHWNDRHRGTQAHSPSALSCGGENHRWARHHAAKITEMMFRHPKRVETERFRGIHLLQPMAVNVAAPAVQFRNVGVKNVVSELHDVRSPLLPQSAGRYLPNPST